MFSDPLFKNQASGFYGEIMKTRNDYIALAIGLLLTCASAIALPVIGKSFGDSLADFDAELPFLLRHAYLLWLLPAIVFAVWLAWPAEKRRALITYLVAISGVTLAYAATVVAIQLEIHRLAATAAV